MLSTPPSQADTEAPSATRRDSLPLWAAVPTGAAGGFALYVAFPSIAWWPMAFVGVGLGLATLTGRRPGGALLVGAVFGAAFHLAHLSWVGKFLGPLPWVALSALQTVLFALGAVAIAAVYRWARTRPGVRARPWIAALAVACVWTAREILIGVWPYSGFPWARLGMSQVNGPFAEVASWVGVSGLSFFVAAVPALLVQAVPPRDISVRIVLAPGLLVIAAALVPQFPTTDAGTLKIGWVQADGPTGYFDDATTGEVLAAQREATGQIAGQDMDLLAWPEGGVDSDPLNDPATAAALDEVSREVGAPLLVNAATQRGPLTYNTSLLWQPGVATQLHDKRNPVPFGEYVPDRWFYRMIAPDLVDLIQREYTPGVLPPVVTVGGVNIGLAICFDVIYDDVIREGAARGAEAFVFQTNNADFRGTDENLQQAAFARMRAIESGRAVVNVSTVGTTQVFAPDGTVLAEAGPGVAAAETTEIVRRTGLTAGITLGPWLTLMVVIGAAVALGASMVTSRRTPLAQAQIEDHE